ncbi:unnamed protein product [Closterium sp. Naga37s-1]|nr:unnamed protein product [Closterium sp. Naga37s-1]
MAHSCFSCRAAASPCRAAVGARPPPATAGELALLQRLQRLAHDCSALIRRFALRQQSLTTWRESAAALAAATCSCYSTSAAPAAPGECVLHLYGDTWRLASGAGDGDQQRLTLSSWTGDRRSAASSPPGGLQQHTSLQQLRLVMHWNSTSSAWRAAAAPAAPGRWQQHHRPAARRQLLVAHGSSSDSLAPDGQQHMAGCSTWRAAAPGELQHLPLTPCSRGGRLHQHGSSSGSSWSPAAGFSEEQLLALDSCSGWLRAAAPAAPGRQQQL